jgi:putative transposase
LERRGNDLLTRHIDRLRDAVQTVRRARPFFIDAWVVLPDHLHCLWTLPPGDDDFSTRWRVIKTIFARSLAVDERRSAVRRRHGERGIWQRRFWEHAIRDDEDFAAHMDYLHFNPVKPNFCTLRPFGGGRARKCWVFHARFRFVVLKRSCDLTLFAAK